MKTYYQHQVASFIQWTLKIYKVKITEQTALHLLHRYEKEQYDKSTDSHP